MYSSERSSNDRTSSPKSSDRRVRCFSREAAAGCSHGRQPMVDGTQTLRQSRRDDRQSAWIESCRPVGAGRCVSERGPRAHARGYNLSSRWDWRPDAFNGLANKFTPERERSGCHAARFSREAAAGCSHGRQPMVCGGHAPGFSREAATGCSHGRQPMVCGTLTLQSPEDI